MKTTHVEFTSTINDQETDVFVSAYVTLGAEATFNDDGYPPEVEIESVFAGDVEIDIKTLSKQDRDHLESKAYDKANQ